MNLLIQGTLSLFATQSIPTKYVPFDIFNTCLGLMSAYVSHPIFEY